ncbi:MAG: imidazolonepropionase [Anaerolineales bacterium]
MLIHTTGQILRLTKNPQRGKSLGLLEIIEGGAIRIDDGRITEISPLGEVKGQHEEILDAGNRLVMPGFVDAHSHPIWAGDRAAEFEQRLEGKSYLEILEAGGGILSTVRTTRGTSLDKLIVLTRSRLRKMFAHGSTTIEAKSGYGLDLETELKLLSALLTVDDEGPWELAITFLGAHAIPEEFKGRAQDYVSELCQTWFPELRTWWAAHSKNRPLPFVDVFCETGAFDLDQTRRILESAKELGFPLKVHADEFDNLGGTRLAAEIGATSADHLISLKEDEIRLLGESETVAVALPATPFGLTLERYAPAKEIIAGNAILALGSDLNPGTAWCESVQFTLALACRYMKLTPAQAIAAATINSAAAIGRQGEIGSLTAGKQADLLILEIEDYRQLGYRFGTNLVHTVVKKGVPYKVQDLA